MKARVVAQQVEARINFEKDKTVFAVLVSLIEFGERLIFFAELRVSCSKSVYPQIRLLVFRQCPQKTLPTAFGKTLSV